MSGNRFKHATKGTLPLDPRTRDVICRRATAPGGEAEFNISQTVISHSPTGMEWGYCGSGPADFAMNILNLFVPPRSDGLAPVKCWAGECSATAWTLHHYFKDKFIAPLPSKGGTIYGGDVLDFLARHATEVRCQGCLARPCCCPND